MVAFPFDTSHFKNIVCPVSPPSSPKTVSNDVDAQYRWAKNVLCCHNAHNGHVDVGWWIVPEFCSRAEDRCDVVVAVVTIEPNQLSHSTFPFAHCQVEPMELHYASQKNSKFSFTSKYFVSGLRHLPSSKVWTIFELLGWPSTLR